ncbi:RecQ family ATP-dependent DNA helicase [Polluticaenibacter yanchengensis]|uniref:ATP-dependent DNA helicase RecQ n=1 Tax=Polluticaenibacter yanchengensis TaxID=3014562 RepID=A0ABT4UI21_9BACT|nr:RecQ family ATP-dependent DNA helicase [Chitinophagaceae bacterium LY-5]
MTDKIHQILKEYFGYDAFRPMQEDIINAVLAANDALALLPTGGGKSVCYQVPGLAMPGMCLVVSPLIALIKDQVMQLRKRGVPVLNIYSGMSFYDVKKTLDDACSGRFRFLFVSPERLQSNLFKEYLSAMPLNMIAVDEAHCISQWGYDFRPNYLKIATVREVHPGIPVLALTASATSQVQKDICEKLAFRTTQLFKQSFAKPNVSFSVFRTAHKHLKLMEIFKGVKGCGLIYVRNRRRTKDVAEYLLSQGINASFYHAGLTNSVREQRQADWLSNKVPVMVCTNAFGMGIDKPDVRVVVHIDIPDCIENYYQEAGRAGRDGQKSYAVLIYHDNDLNELRKLPERKYPPVSEIRKVYKQIGDFLQIHVHSGKGQYYDFDIRMFCETFKVNPSLAVNALNLLQQSGYMTFSESIFIPSKVEFTCNKAVLNDFEAMYPNLSGIIKALLRTYEGIFNNLVSISERKMSKYLHITEEEVVKRLNALNYYRIIHYEPVKDTPQVFLNYDRVTVEELRFDEKLYRMLKERYTERVEKIMEYVTEEQCRSLYMRHYFEDFASDSCGICDVCLAKKRQLLSSREVSDIARTLLGFINESQTEEALRTYAQIPKPQFDQVLHYLLSEEMITYDINKLLVRKK